MQNELPLHPQALNGLELFNHGEYFEAHEVLELAWRDEKGPTRELYRGILQVSVAYHHIQKGKYAGAIKLLKRCQDWLEPFGDQCRGLNLFQFRQDFRRVESELIRLGPEKIEHFDRGLFKPIQLLD